MKIERFRYEVVVMKNKIFVVGGFDGRKNSLKLVEVFDLVIDIWSFIVLVNYLRRDFGLGVI